MDNFLKSVYKVVRLCELYIQLAFNKLGLIGIRFAKKYYKIGLIVFGLVGGVMVFNIGLTYMIKQDNVYYDQVVTSCTEVKSDDFIYDTLYSNLHIDFNDSLYYQSDANGSLYYYDSCRIFTTQQCEQFLSIFIFYDYGVDTSFCNTASNLDLYVDTSPTVGQTIKLVSSNCFQKIYKYNLI